MISRRWCVPVGPAVCLPALLVMVTACRRRGRGLLARGWCTCGAYDLAGGWCTGGPCGVSARPPVMVTACRRRWRGLLAWGWCTCGAHDLAAVVCTGGACGVLPAPPAMVAGMPEAVAGHACGVVVHLRGVWSRGGGVYRWGLWRVACPACHGGGMPEAVAGYACGVAVHLLGA
ncbi:MAG: hypothetical protein MSQ05_01265 [Akkermansia sp.]|nr:hypothetical protein [Akkermansia sp.]